MPLTSHRRHAATSCIALGCVLATVYASNPATATWLPQCPIHAATGFYCPGCGTTRMLHFLLHGHPWLAFQQNALTFLLLPAVFYAILLQWRDATPWKIHPRWIIVFAIVVTAFTVTRNIPRKPFCLLGPGATCR